MFHNSIRLFEKCMVRNSLINHKWGQEERYGQFKFSYNEPFEIIFLAEFEHYKIAVNGVHIGVYRHRLPLHLVNFIRVSGAVKIDHIVLEQDIQAAQVNQVISAVTSNVPSMQGMNSNIHAITTNVPSSFPQQFPIQPSASAPPIHVSYRPPPSYQQQHQQPQNNNRYPPY